MNEILLVIEIIVVFSLVLISKKLFGKTGLFAWMAIASIIANLQTAKSVDFFGLNATLGTVMFASTFLTTDILSECYGVKESKKGVYIGLFSVITFLVCTQMMLLFKPNGLDMANSSMHTLFGLTPRICISSVIMYFLANMADVYLFEKLKKKFNHKKLWLRNNISTIVCNGLENFLFVMVAFIGVYSFKDVLIIGLTTTIIEVVVALCDTPFLYLAKKIKK